MRSTPRVTSSHRPTFASQRGTEGRAPRLVHHRINLFTEGKSGLRLVSTRLGPGFISIRPGPRVIATHVGMASRQSGQLLLKEEAKP